MLPGTGRCSASTPTCACSRHHSTEGPPAGNAPDTQGCILGFTLNLKPQTLNLNAPDLLQLQRRGRGGLGVHRDIGGIAQAQPRQILHAARLRRAEQQRLARRRHVVQDRVERRREALRFPKAKNPPCGQGRG